MYLLLSISSIITLLWVASYVHYVLNFVICVQACTGNLCVYNCKQVQNPIQV